MRKIISKIIFSFLLEFFKRIRGLIFSKIPQNSKLFLKESYFWFLRLFKEMKFLRLNSYNFFSYFWYPNKLKNSRYENLFRIIYKEKSSDLIEVGTSDGEHAYHMIKTAQLFHPKNKVNYYGFDLFEAFKEDDMEEEYYPKRPPSFKYVKKKLETTKANINLYKGYSKDTLPKFIKAIKEQNQKFDFIFIDGGHSINTINLDWNNLKNLMGYNTVVIFDDYYDNEDLIQKYGCNFLIDDLNRDNYDIEILKPQEQSIQNWGILKINMVKVKLKH
jgi:hypothetical protein